MGQASYPVALNTAFALYLTGNWELGNWELGWRKQSDFASSAERGD